MGFLARLFKRNSAGESNISRALKAVADSDNPRARRNLHGALRQQRLILPVPKLPDKLHRDELGRLQESLRLDFLSFQDKGGRKFIAVFTNPEALNRWGSDAATWIAVDTPSICRLAIDSGYSVLKINPGSPHCVEL